MKNIKKIFWKIGIVSAFLLVVAGCGRKDLEPLSGTVMFDGKPLEVGSIVFVTQEITGIEAAAPPTAAGVKDGQFSIPKQYGLKQGSYQVTITGFEGIQRGWLPFGYNIFPDYTTTFEYTGQKTAEFEVPVPRRRPKLPPANAEVLDPASPRP